MTNIRKHQGVHFLIYLLDRKALRHENYRINRYGHGPYTEFGGVGPKPRSILIYHKLPQLIKNLFFLLS